MERQEVVVKDIRMSFGSMVLFMVKWAFAAIPALFIIWVVVAALSALAWIIFGNATGGGPGVPV